MFRPGNKLGGQRKNAGRKTDEFRNKCATLADSPEFFEWAGKVFKGEDVDFRITKEGQTISVPASTGDRIYLWEKLAAYGFGKPATDVDLSELAAPLQKLLNENQAKKLLEAFNYSDRRPEKESVAPVVGNGIAPIQAPFPSTNGV